MTDNENRTVTISIDEYFDLRQKAMMNDYLLDRFGQIESRLMDIDRRLWEVENKKNDR